jgi:hypothetical protein
MSGCLPPDEVDHLNRDPADNRWANLRLAARRENEGNKGVLRSNTSGHRGVSWDKKSQKWRAYGSREHKKLHLGFFVDLEDAAEAAQKWRKDYFGIFAAA